MSGHACFEQMNERLKPHNAQLAHGFALVTIGDKTSLELNHFVQTEKLNKEIRSKKPPLVVMSHCPFCGVNLREAAAA